MVAKKFSLQRIRPFPLYTGMSKVSFVTCALVLASGIADADVDSLGAYTESIAVQVAPFHGIEPRVSRDYNSNARGGLIGGGWILSAGST